MMETWDVVTALFVGLGLAAACGLRVFAPLLVVSGASLAGWLPLTEGFSWVGTWPALAAFAVATVLEMAAFHVPWLDNFLDSVAGPMAVLAGVMVVACALGDVDPLLRWGLAIIAGGGAAGAVQALTSTVRGGSSIATGGIANPVIAATEATASVVLSVVSVLLPVVAAIIVVALFVLMLRVALRVLRARRRRAEAAASTLEQP